MSDKAIIILISPIWEGVSNLGYKIPTDKKPMPVPKYEKKTVLVDCLPIIPKSLNFIRIYEKT
ncbi:MAG: hypothetical protein GVY19_04000 [Bacteroidetes bacterium]|nr:hypothetical protein [Bacteroidota bacterium]